MGRFLAAITYPTHAVGTIICIYKAGKRIIKKLSLRVCPFLGQPEHDEAGLEQS
jgi:hypothetical protein